MKRPSITIRMSGEADTVTVDGVTFDRSIMAQAERNKLRRMIVAAIRQVAR